MDVEQTLCDLIALPSVNPMGGAATGEIFLEGRVTDYLEQLFAAWGLPARRQTVAPGRDNIYTCFRGTRPGVLLLEVHQDTVPVSGMTVPAFEPTRREGRIYGRGACDVKGGMAAMLGALAQLVAAGPAQSPTVVLACTVNEEYGFTGAKALAEQWRRADDALLPAQPDATIVAEPTELQIVVAHKGVARWRGHARGQAVHTSRPDRGDNAIYHMARAVSAIEQYATQVLPRVEPHPLCGGPVASVSMIQGGISVNTVPDRATIEIDRRVMPGEDPQRAYDELCEYVYAQTGRKAIEFESPYLISAGLNDAANGSLAKQLQSVVERTGQATQTLGVPYGTDASVLAGLLGPTVVFGPGSIDQAHTADEWIAVDQLHRASEIYYEFVRSFEP